MDIAEGKWYNKRHEKRVRLRRNSVSRLFVYIENERMQYPGKEREKLRILIAEDERDLNALLKKRLEKQKYTVDACYAEKKRPGSIKKHPQIEKKYSCHAFNG